MANCNILSINVLYDWNVIKTVSCEHLNTIVN